MFKKSILVVDPDELINLLDVAEEYESEFCKRDVLEILFMYAEVSVELGMNIDNTVKKILARDPSDTVQKRVDALYFNMNDESKWALL